MRKILLYSLCFILLCFAIPILFTKGFNNKQVSLSLKNEQIVNENNNLNTDDYDYKEYKTRRSKGRTFY